MSLVNHESLTVSDVLCHFTARTNAPSSMGGQLEQLAIQSDAKGQGPGWRTHAKPALPKRQDPESNVLREASMYRLVSELARVRSVDLDSAETLVKVSYDRKETVGRIVVRSLRAYQGALAAPSEEELDRARARAAKAVPARRAEMFQKAIAEYRAPRGIEAVRVDMGLKTSDEAVALYGDCFIVLGLFVANWNKKARAA